jgi:hypothetical protein
MYTMQAARPRPRGNQDETNHPAHCLMRGRGDFDGERSVGPNIRRAKSIYSQSINRQLRASRFVVVSLKIYRPH